MSLGRYQVSESRGEFSKASSPYLINIFIRSTSSLEDCLRDKFELKVFMVKGTLTLVTMRKYKVFMYPM